MTYFVFTNSSNNMSLSSIAKEILDKNKFGFYKEAKLSFQVKNMNTVMKKYNNQLYSSIGMVYDILDVNNLKSIDQFIRGEKIKNLLSNA